MAEIVRDDEQRLVCRIEPWKYVAAAVLAIVGVLMAAGIITGHHDSHPLTSWDRLANGFWGAFAVLCALAAAGPEDTVLDFATRTFQTRNGLLFFARWQEASFDRIAFLQLRKKRRLGWQIFLVRSEPAGAESVMVTLPDSGAEHLDPRLRAHRLMESIARRSSIAIVDLTGQPLGPAAAGLLPPEAVSPQPAPRQPAVPLRGEVKTRRYTLVPDGEGARLVKSRWFVLQYEGDTLIWAACAGPTLAFILLSSGLIWRAPSELLSAGLKFADVTLHPPAPGGNPYQRTEAILELVVAGVICVLVLLAVVAWWQLLQAAGKVVRGDEWHFDPARDRFSHNGFTIARVSEIQAFDVREHSASGRSGGRRWYALSVITTDDRRITLDLGEFEELSVLGRELGACLGVEAIAS